MVSSSAPVVIYQIQPFAKKDGKYTPVAIPLVVSNSNRRALEERDDQPTAIPISLFDSSSFHTIFLDANTSQTLYGLGSNTNGQLASRPPYSSSGQVYEIPQNIHRSQAHVIKLKQRVVSIACGSTYTVIVYKNGQVYMCGYCKGVTDHDLQYLDPNDPSANIELAATAQWFTFQRVGRNSDDKRREVAHKPIVEKVVACYSGDEHILLLQEDGNVIVGGCNTSGQCGLNSTKNYVHLQQNSFLKNKRIKAISCGATHTVVLTKDNSIWCFGSNYDGECGISEKRKENLESSIPIPLLRGILLPKQLQYSKLLNEEIVKISCGMNHTIVLTTNHVYASGSNHHFQCGISSDNKPRHQFSKVTQLSGKNITNVICSDNVTVFVEDSSKLYACGEGFGKLSRLELDLNVVGVVAQYDRLLILSASFV